jgi:hypothetical protein
MSYTSGQIDSQSYTYKPSLFETVQAKNIATEKFRDKWGGVISRSYSSGDDLSSNKFTGTATQTDVVRSLIQGNTSGNLEQFLSERGYDVNAIMGGSQIVAQNIFSPEKQTTARAVLAQREAVLNQGISLPEFDLTKITSSLDLGNWLQKAEEAIKTQVRTMPNGNEKTIPKIEAEKFYEPDQNMGNKGYPHHVDTIGIGLYSGGTIIILLILYFLIARRK